MKTGSSSAAPNRKFAVASANFRYPLFVAETSRTTEIQKARSLGDDWAPKYDCEQDSRNATKAYERAFEIDPGISSVLSGLAQIKDHGGDKATAAALERLVDTLAPQLRNGGPNSTGPNLGTVVAFSNYCSTLG